MSKITDLKFELVSGCLLVTATGRQAVDHKEATIRAIGDEIKARSAKAALVDMRGVAKPYGFMDRYQLGEMAGRYLTAVPVGVLSRVQQVDPGRIGKLVANNRGAKLEVFTDETTAYAWLKKFQGSAPAQENIPASPLAKHAGRASKPAAGK